MDDSIWWLFFAFSAGIGLFFSILMLMRPSRIRAGTLPLILMISLFSIILIQYVIFWSENINKFPHLTGIWRIITYCFGPLFWLYMKADASSKFNWRQILHFIPAFILFAAWLPFFLLSTEDKLLWFQGQYVFSSFLSKTPILPWLLSLWVMLLHQLIYIFLAVWYFRKKKQEKVKRHILILFAIFWLAQLSYVILIRFSFFNKDWDYMISLAMTLCIFSIGSMSFHRPEYFFTPLRLPSAKKYSSSALNEKYARELALQIQKHVEKHESFLKPELRLPHLAQELQLSAQQLSQAINQGFGISYSDWINGYRVNYAKALLGQGHSAKEAGYQAGFKSMSTFYEAFKKETGTTPASFAKSS